jgi:hypothetical protein
MLSVTFLIVMLRLNDKYSYAEISNAECRILNSYAECLNAQCRNAECHGATQSALFHFLNEAYWSTVSFSSLPTQILKSFHSWTNVIKLI